MNRTEEGERERERRGKEWKVWRESKSRETRRRRMKLERRKRVSWIADIGSGREEGREEPRQLKLEKRFSIGAK